MKRAILAGPPFVTLLYYDVEQNMFHHHRNIARIFFLFLFLFFTVILSLTSGGEMGKCRHIFSRVEQQCTTTVIFLSNHPSGPCRCVLSSYRGQSAGAIWLLFFFFVFLIHILNKSLVEMCHICVDKLCTNQYISHIHIHRLLRLYFIFQKMN